MSLVETVLLLAQYEVSAIFCIPPRPPRTQAAPPHRARPQRLTTLDAATCFPHGTPPPPPIRLPQLGVRAFRGKECRRVVWGTLSLATSLKRMARCKVDVCHALHMCDPANVRFPLSGLLWPHVVCGG